MVKVLQIESTLTDRYQTTIPEPIREALHLRKRDKITFSIAGNGKVLLSRFEADDPVIGKFLAFLVNDIERNPSHIKTLNPTLLERAQALVSDIEVDLDAPLSEEDE